MTKVETVEINRKLDTILAKQITHGEGLVRIDEHLKTLNGSVKRHELCIEKLDADNDKQWTVINNHFEKAAEFKGMVNARLAMVGLGSGSIVAVVAWLVNCF